MRALPHVTAEMYEYSAIYNRAAAVDKTLQTTDPDALALLEISREAEVLFTRGDWDRFVSPMGRPQTIPRSAWVLPTIRQLASAAVHTLSAELPDCNCNSEGPELSGWNCADGDGCYGQH